MPKTKRKTWLRRVLWCFCRLWLVCGLATFVAGFGFMTYTSVWLFRSVPGQGTVIDLIPQKDDNGNINYCARFRFKAHDGKAYTATAGVATNPPSFEIGENVRVRYLPTDPMSAKLSYFWQLWFEPVLCAGLGVVFSGAGYLLLRRDLCAHRSHVRSQRQACVSRRLYMWVGVSVDWGNPGFTFMQRYRW
jgi:hypothetical protein